MNPSESARNRCGLFLETLGVSSRYTGHCTSDLCRAQQPGIDTSDVCFVRNKRTAMRGRGNFYAKKLRGVLDTTHHGDVVGELCFVSGFWLCWH